MRLAFFSNFAAIVLSVTMGKYYIKGFALCLYLFRPKRDGRLLTVMRQVYKFKQISYLIEFGLFYIPAVSARGSKYLLCIRGVIMDSRVFIWWQGVVRKTVDRQT